MDAGTGGGFPGIPLAILFPDVTFHLVDSIGKKLKVVDHIARETGLNNITTEHKRVEHVEKQFDFIISRAVTTLPEFLGWCDQKIRSGSFNDLENGVLSLKGGDLEHELTSIKRPYRIFSIDRFFHESYFQEKKIAYIPL